MNEQSNLKRHQHCPMRTHVGNCIIIGGFCTSIREDICDALHKSFQMGTRSRAVDKANDDAISRERLLNEERMEKMRTMTITEALVELKLLDKRITNSDMQDWCIIQLKQEKKTMAGETVEEYEQETKARFQSVKDLITERANIKKAIVKSNADTVVEVGDLKMTVAEAIEYKTSIEYERRLLQSLRRSKAAAEEGKISHEARLDREVSNVIGKLAESGKDNLSEEQKNFTESYRQMNEAVIIDPIDIDKQISELETKIDSFEQNIDVALSVSNATTFIKI